MALCGGTLKVLIGKGAHVLEATGNALRMLGNSRESKARAWGSRPVRFRARGAIRAACREEDVSGAESENGHYYISKVASVYRTPYETSSTVDPPSSRSASIATVHVSRAVFGFDVNHEGAEVGGSTVPRLFRHQQALLAASTKSGVTSRARNDQTRRPPDRHRRKCRGESLELLRAELRSKVGEVCAEADPSPEALRDSFLSIATVGSHTKWSGLSRDKNSVAGGEKRSIQTRRIEYIPFSTLIL
ncbi:hypothetical protein BDK51DRAFT_48918 [Blyttiomyces helicus]|uniref:Uncharacterized protein n=1 Tax=Blyttiomyces helicus TaxID=388810 RepID=A0A4P9W6J1_9FUNG|nr:hypothetical protein BDK51DRAFT_48918 [Blyttiomyces helicus]|eukprot:RKO88079.1 hypothetical protein BDK51DRAFT_48918 [Blyttiomyces helicus]